jgi:hypothetical protein
LVAIRGRIVIRRRRRIVAKAGRIIGICGRRRIVAIRGRTIDIRHNIAAAVQATPIANFLDRRDHDGWAGHYTALAGLPERAPCPHKRHPQ